MLILFVLAIVICSALFFVIRWVREERKKLGAENIDIEEFVPSYQKKVILVFVLAVIVSVISGYIIYYAIDYFVGWESLDKTTRLVLFPIPLIPLFVVIGGYTLLIYLKYWDKIQK